MSDWVRSANVACAALVVELAQRDGALARYQTLRRRYEVTRLVCMRKQRLMASHTGTLSQLQSLLASVLARQASAGESASAEVEVPDTLVAAVRVLLAVTRCDHVKEKLQVMLARYVVGRVPRSMSPAPVSFCSFTVPAGSDGSSRIVPQDTACGTVPLQLVVHLRPLLCWSNALLSYQCVLPARRLLASEVARVSYQASILAAENAAGDPDMVARAQKQQTVALEDARAELKKAKDLQRCVKRRLYEVHQQISKGARSSDTETMGHPDPRAAAEMHAQIKKELRKGRVTLLRILCEGKTSPSL
ncbi:hypothetical protein ABL78_2892 [Leptomonas seymouri]|uniref:Uncharacterized protein n=1 Tax=Leptomonas seymouri TaxID=5684 RepID=A0A0N0P6T8_LEPSE|nr:hypothetical protein ABL78_2892 [Leptomonas seymouri]|eukprot:KPI88016.1 hypothetical protein ABL78_2892 [Leptomonas seymouri]